MCYNIGQNCRCLYLWTYLSMHITTLRVFLWKQWHSKFVVDIFSFKRCCCQYQAINFMWHIMYLQLKTTQISDFKMSAYGAEGILWDCVLFWHRMLVKFMINHLILGILNLTNGLSFRKKHWIDWNFLLWIQFSLIRFKINHSQKYFKRLRAVRLSLYDLERSV